MSDFTQHQFPYRENYQPPEPDGDQPSQVTARAITVEGSIVRQASAEIEHAKSEFIKHLSTTAEQRHHYSTTGYDAQIKAFAQTAAAKAVTASVQKVQQRREQAQVKVAKIKRALSPDGDTAAEMRASRYWARTKALLDRADGGTVGPTARRLINEAESAELGTLLQELRPYLQSRGHDSDGWLDAALGQAVPELAAAQAQLLQAEKAEQVVAYNADVMARAFAQGSQPAALVDPSDYDPDAE